MKPPKAPDIGMSAETSDPSSAVCACSAIVIETLKNRPDFLKAAQARRQGTGGFLLQGRARDDGADLVRVGFTASKKIGNAVARNRAKRRLRAAAYALLPLSGRPGHDYVLVARAGILVRDFAALKDDITEAARAAHRKLDAQSTPDRA